MFTSFNSSDWLFPCQTCVILLFSLKMFLNLLQQLENGPNCGKLLLPIACVLNSW